MEVASLIRVGPAQNEWRFYRMEVWPNLFGAPEATGMTTNTRLSILIDAWPEMDRRLW